MNFGRHFMAMGGMAIGMALGVILAITVNWQTGVIVGVVICLAAFLFAAWNMAQGFRSFDDEFSSFQSRFDTPQDKRRARRRSR